MFEFFEATLPSRGFICIGTLRESGGFHHKWFAEDRKQAAYDYAIAQDGKGETVYYAQSGFVEPTNRKSENAGWFKSYWLDIDTGPDKPFSNQVEGFKALKDFCEKAALPLPSVVNSGTGLYAYWLLEEDIEAKVWVATASVLKGLCTKLEFHVDPVRTADRSSVLRPVGATNRKGNNAKPVRLVVSSESVSSKTFTDSLVAAADKYKVAVYSLAAPATQLNSEFQLEMGSEKPLADKIADKCAQMGLVREKKGDVSEPLWRAAIGLLKHCADDQEIIHEWSCGHPDYDREATDKKVEGFKTPASTCHYFHSINPDACVGCRYHGKINSPWRLGLPEPKPVELTEEEKAKSAVDVKLPLGFLRTDKGIVYDDGEEAVVNVFPYDLLPVKLTQDETLGQEIMCLTAKDPHVGWFDVQIRTALLHDPKAMFMCLADQGIHPYFGKTEKALFMQLLSGYMQQLKDNRRKMILSQQMGWIDEPDGSEAFVLGDRLVSKRGVETVGIAKGADAVVRSITKQGDLETWAEATKMLNGVGLEPWAFTLAALGFGAPLMKFTGYKGSMLSMVGRSGLGKTAMGWWALSVWGNPEKLQMIQRDTQNATVARMSLYNNLPLFIDEITNIKQEVLSDLAYQITQGRDKHTLTRNRTERSALTWATIGAASSNKSLVDILGGYKSDPSAEINRIFEYEFPSGTVFDGVSAYRMFMKNYGVVGEEYVKYLVDHQDEHADNLLKIQGAIEKEAGCRPEERFWAITAACALYGAAIAKKLGMFHVDLVRLRAWVLTAIRQMRGVRDDTVVDSPSWIGTFLSKYASNMLVVRDGGKGLYHAQVEPRGPLYIRKDNDTGTVWIARELLKRELLAGSASYSKIKSELVASRALVSDNKRMVLGKGTSWAGVSEICWVLDLNVPSLGHTAVQLLKAEEEVGDVKTTA